MTIPIAHPRTAGTPFRCKSREVTGGLPSDSSGLQFWLRRTSQAAAPLDVALEFKVLAERWHDQADGLSSPNQIAGTQSYLDIIALGRAVIPYILRDLQTRGGFWYPALLSLTKEWPVPEEANGIPRLMKSAWLEWGRQRGYVS